jgi:hypothetical protein
MRASFPNLKQLDIKLSCMDHDENDYLEEIPYSRRGTLLADVTIETRHLPPKQSCTAI